MAQRFDNFQPYSEAKEPAGESHPLRFFQRIDEFHRNFNMISIMKIGSYSRVNNLSQKIEPFSETLDRVREYEYIHPVRGFKLSPL